MRTFGNGRWEHTIRMNGCAITLRIQVDDGRSMPGWTDADDSRPALKRAMIIHQLYCLNRRVSPTTGERRHEVPRNKLNSRKHPAPPSPNWRNGWVYLCPQGRAIEQEENRHE